MCMTYESIEQATATLTRHEQLKLLTYLANLLKESEERNEKNEKKDFSASYHKGFFDLFGSDPDFDLEEPDNSCDSLDEEVSFE